MDNWYTSRVLLTTCIRTIQLHVELPERIESSYQNVFADAPLAKGEHSFCRHDDLLAVRFNDKETYFFSTIH